MPIKLLQELRDAALEKGGATARALGHGFTGGTLQYLMAPAVAGAARLFEGVPYEPGMALDVIRQRRAEDFQKNTIPTIVGDVAGTVLGPGKVVRAVGTTVPRAIGAGTATGAFTGYTENLNPSEAATGATLGLLGGAVGEAASKGIRFGAKKVMQRETTKQLAADKQAFKEAAQEVDDLTKAMQSLKAAGQDTADIEARIGAIRHVEMPRLQMEAFKSSQQKAIAFNPKATDEEIYNLVASRKTGLMPRAIQDIQENLGMGGGQLGQLGVGGGLGYLLGSAAGLDPATAAAIGLGTAPLAAPAFRFKLGLASKYATPENVRQAVGGGVIPEASRITSMLTAPSNEAYSILPEPAAMPPSVVPASPSAAASAPVRYSLDDLAEYEVKK